MKRIIAFLAVAISAAAASGDWPQWGGPGRDFKSDVTGLAAKWPDAGPKKLWSRELGEGYSTVSVEGGQLYTMFHRANQDVVTALDAATGKTIWEFAYDTPMTDKTDLTYGPGPHSAPLVVGDQVFAASATGLFHALDRKTGKKLWSHDLIGEFGGYLRPNGYNCSPIAYKNTVIMLVGGPDAAIVAFNKKDGTVAWKKHSYKTANSSPILIRFEGQEQLVAMMFEEVVGLDPATGDLLWSHPHKTDFGLNVSTPVWGEDNLLFMSSAYNNGSKVIRLKRNGAKIETEELWASRLMRIHFGNAIRVGDVVYGSSGDFGPAPLTAVDVKTGQILWRNRGLARASYVMADGKLIALDEDGNLALLTVNAQGATIVSKAQVLERTAWTAPTLAGSSLYIRDRKHLMALDLK
jgi:outer membrane protein assembly factor BamB